MTGKSSQQTSQWDANRIALEAEQRLRPDSQSRLLRLVCRLSGHEWHVHSFVDGENEYRAVTCRVCSELRVSGEHTTEESL